MGLTMRIYFFNLLFIFAFVYTKGEVQNNLIIVDNLVYDIIEGNISDKYKSRNDSILLIDKDSSSEVKEYIFLTVSKTLLDKSWKVFRNFIPGNSFQGYVLEIENSSVKIVYSKPYTKKFLGKSYVKRKVTVNIGFQLYYNQSNQVLGADVKILEKEDEIKYNQINDLEKSSYSFTIGHQSGHSFWHRIFEPVLVISGCAVIVYLFFTQRV
jgi:hypothetical protein